MQCFTTRRSFCSSSRLRIETMHQMMIRQRPMMTMVTFRKNLSNIIARSQSFECNNQTTTFYQQQQRWFSSNNGNSNDKNANASTPLPPPTTATIDPYQLDRRHKKQEQLDDSESDKGKTVEQFVSDHQDNQDKTVEIHLQDPSVSIPTWRALLEPAARAKWRSSPHNPPYELAEQQFQMLQKTNFSSKHLRRVNEKLISAHGALGERRERERRRQINPRKVRQDSIAFKAEQQRDTKVGAIPYKAEQTLAYMKFRLLPNYAIIKRVLMEAQSLLTSAGTPRNNNGTALWNPKRIIDFGIGSGSASAAALDVFGSNNNGKNQNQLEWIHGIDPSQSQREAADLILQRILNTKKEESMENNNNAVDYIPPRITLGESLSVGKSFSSSASDTTTPAAAATGGGFDLALYTYTAAEIPHVPATLTAAALLWEKLRPNGVMVIVEPGTPDGFNTIRSIRDMLLDCCPPPSLQSDDLDDPSSKEEDYFDDYQNSPSNNKTMATEECHVIAPCTHNGTCPMERHIADFKKKGDTTLSSKDDKEEGEDIEEEDLDGDDDDKDDDDFDWDSYDDDDDDDDEEGVQQSNHTDEKSTPKSDGSGMDETHAFDTAFCSFVHTFPGGTTRKSGEKFSYLVVQKRVPNPSSSALSTDNEVNGTATTTTELQNVYNFANVSDLLAETCLAGKAVKKVQRKKAERFVRDAAQHDKLLQDAETLKDEYYALEEDKLGLELLHGDENRQGFGRIVRAPLKRRGHILVDYCGQSSNGREGRIVRHRVSKGWSKRVVPGMFGAARKARWGGYWPDIKQKMTEHDNDDASFAPNEFEIKVTGEEWSTLKTKGRQ